MNSYFDIKKFKLLNKISDGGYSNVYKIQNIKTGQFFAAKIFRDEIDSQNIKNLTREIVIFSHISHPAAIKYFGCSMKDFNNENHLVIVSEIAENGSLEQIIRLERKKESPSNWNDTKKLINIYGIASAMRYLHSKCIVHRDLKPSNILEDHNFYPKICDFGSSRLQRNESIYYQKWYPFTLPLKFLTIVIHIHFYVTFFLLG